MDAVYARHQPDIHFYVPGGDHYPAFEAIRFQTSLRGVHKPEDAGGGIGGGVATLAEQVMEGVVVTAELLSAGVVVKQVLEFAAKIVGGQLVLDQFFDDQFVHDEVDEGNIFYFDEPAGDLVREGAAFITHNFGDAKEGGFEGGGPGGDEGCL